MTIMTQKLAAAAAAKVAPAADTMLGRARLQCLRGEFVTLPVLGRVWIELAAEAVVDEIESAVFSAMAALRIPLNEINSLTYDSRRLALTLAWAVRNPDKIEEHAGTQDQWIGLDVDLLSACGVVYRDVRVRLNPLDQPIDEGVFQEIRAACEKKNARLLRTYGLALLSSYLASTGAPPASSPEPPLSTGPL